MRPVASVAEESDNCSERKRADWSAKLSTGGSERESTLESKTVEGTERRGWERGSVLKEEEGTEPSNEFAPTREKAAPTRFSGAATCPGQRAGSEDAKVVVRIGEMEPVDPIFREVEAEEAE